MCIIFKKEKGSETLNCKRFTIYYWYLREIMCNLFSSIKKVKKRGEGLNVGYSYLQFNLII